MVVWLFLESFFAIKNTHIANEQYSKNQLNYRKQNYFNQVYSDFKVAKELRVFNLKDWLKNNSLKTIESIKTHDLKTNNADLKLGIMQSIYQYIRDMLLFFILIIEVTNGKIAITEAVVMIALTFDFNYLLHELSKQFNRCVTPILMSTDLVNYLSKDLINESLNKLNITKIQSIAFNHLSFHYPKSKNIILNDINFTIESGQKIAIIGINGAGKTTMIKVLMNLLQPSSGFISINNQNIHSYNVSHLFAPVFQDPLILSDTIKANIILNEDYDENLFFDVLKAVKLQPLIKRLDNGINTILTRYLDEDGIMLSGGEEQRIMMARALYSQRPILVLDEPTAALDAHSEAGFYELVNHLSKDKTVFFISHRLASTQFCDQILVLNNNRIEEFGSHEVLLSKKGVYYNMFQQQAFYYREERLNDDEN